MTAAGKSYFRYHFRSKWKFLLCLIVVAIVLTLAYSSGHKVGDISFYEGNSEIDRTYYLSRLETSLYILIACSCVLPVIEFATFKKRRNLDCFYALPISRREMGISHYITGLICVIVPYTVAYLLNGLMMLRYPEGFHYGPLWGYYFISLGLGLSIYSISVFVFDRANTVFDGICFMFLWLFLIYCIVEAYNSLSYNLYKCRLPEDYPRYLIYAKWKETYAIPETALTNPFVALIDLEMYYDQLITKETPYFIRSTTIEADWTFFAWLIAWGVIGVVAAVGFVFNFAKTRPEKTGEASDSWFGYKMLIPFYAILATVPTSGRNIIIVSIAAFAGYVIYRRGFRLKLCDWLTLAGIFSLGFTLLLINIFIYVIVYLDEIIIRLL